MNQLTQKNVTNLVSEFPGQANVLIIPRVFITLLMDIKTALLLSHLIYSQANSEWISKTYSEWRTETSLSEYQVRSSANTLKKLDLIETKVKKARGNPIVHYRVKEDNFLKWINKKRSEL